jgi:2',3'-cyclic-nucleotide 2'-phosphodiesterase (5'-nucleotidase family)
VAHEGAFCSAQDSTCRGEIVDIAQSLVNKPDLIVSGHTHSLVTTVVNGIPIIQARSGGTALGIADIVATGGARAVRMRVETVWADREQPDSAVAAVVRRYLDEVRPITERVIATLAQDLPRDGNQYHLADLVADAVRAAAAADVGLVNNTGIRAPLSAGPVSWGQLYEVLPFGNFVVKIPVTGAVLREALYHALGSGEARASIAGATVRVDRTRDGPASIADVRLTDGRLVHDDSTYTLATFDFLAAGGSGYSMLRGRPFTSTGIDELDAFIALLRRLPQPIRVALPHVPRITGQD